MIKGTIRIKIHIGSTPLKSPQLEELPNRPPVVVKVGDVEYWEWRDLDLEQEATR